MLLGQLYALQNVDGGWGWRSGGGSNLQVTSYVVHAMVRALKAGLEVRAPTLASGLANVQNQLAEGIESGLRSPHLAFALSALVEAGRERPEGVGSALYADRDKIGVSGRAYLALAFGALDASDTRVSSLLQELRGMVLLSGSGAHWEDPSAQHWSSSVQSTALALTALTRYAPEDPLLPDIVRWLAASARTGEAMTPYEAAWVVAALSEYAVASDNVVAAYDWHVALNGATVADAGATVQSQPDADSGWLWLGPRAASRGTECDRDCEGSGIWAPVLLYGLQSKPASGPGRWLASNAASSSRDSTVPSRKMRSLSCHLKRTHVGRLVALLLGRRLRYS